MKSLELKLKEAQTVVNSIHKKLRWAEFKRLYREIDRKRTEDTIRLFEIYPEFKISQEEKKK